MIKHHFMGFMTFTWFFITTKCRINRLHADEETVARSLCGNRREEHIFALTQALEHYDFLGEQIQACDKLIGQQFTGLPQLADNPPKPGKVLRNPVAYNYTANVAPGSLWCNGRWFNGYS